MIVDLNNRPTLPTDAAVMIVGGGTVAMLMALALHRRGVPTLVLESGGFGFDPDCQSLNTATIVGRPHDGLANARARVIGGTSTLWGGQLARFRPEDFDARTGMASAPWPIGYNDLAPHYDAAARLLRLVERLDDDAAVCRELFGDSGPDFGAFDIFYTRWLKEPRVFRMFERELRDSRCVTIALHAHVVQLAAQRDPGRISSVRVACPDGTQVELNAPTIVLANGTMEIVRTMLASARANPALRFAANPWLGVGFQDHLDLRAARIDVLDKRRFDDLFQNVVLDGQKLQPKLRIHMPGAKATTGNHVAASMMYESSMAEHMHYAKVLVKSLRTGRLSGNLSDAVRHARGLAHVWLPVVHRYWRHRRIYAPADRGTFLILHCEQVPVTHSRIDLHPHRCDRFGIPQLRLNWEIEGPSEIEAMRSFAVELDRQLRSMKLAALQIDELLLNSDPAILDKCTDSYHQCGGARMGHDAEDGVVNSNLQVFGMSNLYIAGAACYRTSSYANPTFTAAALSLRLVEHLCNRS